VDRRFTLFAILVAVGFVANHFIYTKLFPPDPNELVKPAAVAKAKPAPGKPAHPAKDKPAAELEPAADKPAAQATEKPGTAAEQGVPKDEEPDAAKNAAAVATQWGVLGSTDPDSPYRMLTTWTNRGAAIVRLELNSARYHDLEDRSGYLGHLEPADAPEKAGALVQVVGAGTPADLAGLKPADVITAVDDQKVRSAESLVDVLKTTRPSQTIQIAINREGNPKLLTAELRRRPLQVMRPELDSQPLEIVLPNKHDPLSFLMTIQQFDDRTLSDDNGELGGVDLRHSAWEVIVASQDIVKFRKVLPKLGLQVTKTYRLAKVPGDQLADADYPAYNLLLDVSIANVGKQTHKVAYRLEGPTGLPIEGAWYANKVSRTWGGAGMRDVIVHFDGGTTEQIGCAQIADSEFKRTFANSPLDFIAVDGIYFSAAVIPQKQAPGDILFAEVKPIRVGALPAEKANYKLTDVSFRLDSITAEVAPDGPPLEHHLQIFAGPKRPTLLAQYGPPTATLNDLIYYGWFGIVARPMLVILHAFHYVVGNYGLSIIMLTVLVRGCMFPLSRKQALNAQKMQELQPEIKRLQEKYKGETDKKTKAQQELFRQHNYNPLSGCLPAVVQLPIFVGLYRSLMVDIELRQAPLFGEGIRWASNLAAPDMFWDWTGVMPEFVTHGTGFFGLGPYLNILPLVTIGLFIWQQKMFMPPPADEQAALQQKMMQYMMIFMGIMFFKVASGLCVYFIASSIWGICERKLLPKATPAAAGAGSAGTAILSASSGSSNGAAASKKRQRGRK
jgi:YidC/Oxa1 family membrane protein insertase